MAIQPESIDFGRGWLGEESGPLETFWVSQIADGAKLDARFESIGAPDNADAFHVEGELESTLVGSVVMGAPGAIRFTPTREGNYLAWLVVCSDDGSEARTLVKGEGYKTAECAPGEAGVMLTGHEVPMSPENPYRSVVVQNTCEGVVTINALEPILGAIDDFEFSTSELPRTLEPGEAVHFDLEFHPLSPENERILTFHLDTSQGGLDFTISGVTERAFFLEPHERATAEETARDNIILAKSDFGDACVAHDAALRDAGKEESFLDVVIDIALGALLPGLAGRAIDALADAVPNRSLPSWIGMKALDYKTNISSGAAGLVRDNVKELAQDESSDKKVWLNKLRQRMSQGFVATLERVRNGGMLDAELLATVLVFDPTVVNYANYSAQISNYLSLYQSEVEPISEAGVGPAGGYGSPGRFETRAAWIEHDGQRRLALGSHLSPIGSRAPWSVFAFERWATREMWSSIVERQEKVLPDVGVPALSLSEAQVSEKQWEEGE